MAAPILYNQKQETVFLVLISPQIESGTFSLYRTFRIHCKLFFNHHVIYFIEIAKPVLIFISNAILKITLTFSLGFSITALKLKEDGLGFVMSSSVQENKLWTLFFKSNFEGLNWCIDYNQVPYNKLFY